MCSTENVLQIQWHHNSEQTGCRGMEHPCGSSSILAAIRSARHQFILLTALPNYSGVTLHEFMSLFGPSEQEFQLSPLCIRFDVDPHARRATGRCCIFIMSTRTIELASLIDYWVSHDFQWSMPKPDNILSICFHTLRLDSIYMAYCSILSLGGVGVRRVYIQNYFPKMVDRDSSRAN